MLPLLAGGETLFAIEPDGSWIARYGWVFEVCVYRKDRVAYLGMRPFSLWCIGKPAPNIAGLCSFAAICKSNGVESIAYHR